MTYLQKPKFHHPALPRNELGLTRRDYEGAITTLCAGCGHDSVSAAIIEACFELSVPAHRVVKLSGIGCSSKTPTYFLGQSHGFNSVHGRMPSIATGANLANGGLVYLGVSGDGDTASIGLGQFAHAMRRRLNMLYVLENNGTYGLTKGQFSATNDRTSPDRYGRPNPFDAIDVASLGIMLGATYVARGFSGDKEQLVPLIKAGLQHKGFALIDVISPCVTFNNHKASTKSFDFVREHNHAVAAPDYVAPKATIHADYAPGEAHEVMLHDGETTMTLRKLDPAYDPFDRQRALGAIMESQAKGEVITGLLYADPGAGDLHDVLQTTETPLNRLGEAELCPGSTALEKINESLR